MVGYLNQDSLDLTENKYDICNEGDGRIFEMYLYNLEHFRTEICGVCHNFSKSTIPFLNFSPRSITRRKGGQSCRYCLLPLKLVIWK